MKKTPNAERRTPNAERRSKPKPNKRVTPRAASFARIAQEHRSYRRSHNAIWFAKGISKADKLFHRTLALFHDECASINAAEAKRLRAQR